jgi:hypothetical protein
MRVVTATKGPVRLLDHHRRQVRLGPRPYFTERYRAGLRPLVTPARSASTAAGMLRWAVIAQTTAVKALALVQPLHGLPFALLHVACMRLITHTVPPASTGQRKRSTRSASAPPLPCSPWSPASSTHAWARTGFGS